MPNLQMYLVGVDAPTFCDQAYIRDRDEKIQAKHVENDFPTYVFDGKF